MILWCPVPTALDRAIVGAMLAPQGEEPSGGYSGSVTGPNSLRRSLSRQDHFNFIQGLLASQNKDSFCVCVGGVVFLLLNNWTRHDHDSGRKQRRTSILFSQTDLVFFYLKFQWIDFWTFVKNLCFPAVHWGAIYYAEIPEGPQWVDFNYRNRILYLSIVTDVYEINKKINQI